MNSRRATCYDGGMNQPLEPCRPRNSAEPSKSRGPTPRPAAALRTWRHDEPSKAALSAHSADGTSIDRRVCFRLVTGPEMACTEALVSLTSENVVAVTEVQGVCPTILIEEGWLTADAVRADPRWQEAMRRRGIDDFDRVEVDTWPAGRFGLAEEHRRLGRAISYLRDQPHDNQHARPIEGVIALVDLGRAEVLDVVDHGAVPIPAGRGRYQSADTKPWRDDLRPIEIVQPEGPSFTIEGNVLRWQRWSMRVTLEPHEGLVFHTVGYEDHGRTRSILHRASITEMVVPLTGIGVRMHGWKKRVRRQRVGTRRKDGQLADARLRLPRRHPLSRRGDGR